MTTLDAEAFWRYAVAVYGREGVQERCLHLQDAHGADVNILLFVAWLAEAHGRWLTPADCRRLIAATEEWRRGVIMPIRTVRRRVKTMAEAEPAHDFVYGSLKQTELDAERAQHGLMIDAAGGLGRVVAEATALANMRAYLEGEGIEPDGEAGEAVAAISRLASP